MLVLPAAMLADRGRPVAIALPLLFWLPAELLPFVALLATILPFRARRPDRGHGYRLDAGTVATEGP